MQQRNTGKSLRFARGISCTAQSNMDSDCQSIWLARKQDVFNPGCCQLCCCWFHQICTMLSIQDLTLRHKGTKSHCSVAPLLCVFFFLNHSITVVFHLCRFPIVEQYPTSCTVQLERGASSSEQADGCFWVVSRCLCVSLWLLSFWRKEEQMFIDLGRWSAGF